MECASKSVILQALLAGWAAPCHSTYSQADEAVLIAVHLIRLCLSDHADLGRVAHASHIASRIIRGACARDLRKVGRGEAFVAVLQRPPVVRCPVGAVGCHSLGAQAGCHRRAGSDCSEACRLWQVVAPPVVVDGGAGGREGGGTQGGQREDRGKGRGSESGIAVWCITARHLRTLKWSSCARRPIPNEHATAGSPPCALEAPDASPAL